MVKHPTPKDIFEFFQSIGMPKECIVCEDELGLGIYAVVVKPEWFEWFDPRQLIPWYWGIYLCEGCLCHAQTDPHVNQNMEIAVEFQVKAFLDNVAIAELN